jgi:TPR repeat protein
MTTTESSFPWLPPFPADAACEHSPVVKLVACCLRSQAPAAEKYDADRLCAGSRSVYYFALQSVSARGRATSRRAGWRRGKGGGSAPAAAALERVGHPASQWVAGAARGEAEALYHLGMCYDTGKGVPQSYERAAELYTRKALSERGPPLS